MKMPNLPRRSLLAMVLCTLVLFAGCAADRSGPSSAEGSAFQSAAAVQAERSESPPADKRMEKGASRSAEPAGEDQSAPPRAVKSAEGSHSAEPVVPETGSVPEEVLYLPLEQSRTLSGDDWSDGVYLFSPAPSVIRADGKTITGEGVGAVELELRSSRDELLDRVRVYCFRPTVLSRGKGKNTREKPADLIAQCGDVRRVYPLVCQQKQKDKSYGTFLSRHGCTVCASAAVCQAMGAKTMTVDWMMTGGLEKIARADGRTMQDDSLGYYGLQKVLEYGGISSKIYSDWESIPAAAEELVRSLSDGRPILLYLDNRAVWNDIGPLCVALHCVVLTGISEDGYVQMINSSYPQSVSCFYNRTKEKSESVRLTPEELLEHFVRKTHTKRQQQKDFYFTKKGGMHTFLDVTCQSAQTTK